MSETAVGAEAASGPATPPPPPHPARRRTVLLAAGALAVAAAVVAGVLAAGGSGDGSHAARTADGLRHTTVEVTSARCGHGWTHPEAGRQLRLRRPVGAQKAIRPLRAGG